MLGGDTADPNWAIPHHMMPCSVIKLEVEAGGQPTRKTLTKCAGGKRAIPPSRKSRDRFSPCERFVRDLAALRPLGLAGQGGGGGGELG